MNKRSEHLWRLLATAGCFGVFYASSAVAIGLVLPVLRLVIRNSTSRSSAVRWIIYTYFRFFVRLMILVGIIRVSVTGADQLASRGPRMVIANHPSYLDIVILLSRIPHACCIMNSKLQSNPFVSMIPTAAGYIYNRTDSDQLVKDCVRELKSGSPLIIFPEGTRSVPGQPYRFHRGFAHIVLRSGVDIQPVTIDCAPPMLVKGVPWHRIPERPAAFILNVRPRIKASDIVDAREEPAIAAREITKHLEQFYLQEMGTRERE